MEKNNNTDSKLSENEIILGYVKTIIKYINDENLIATKDIDNNFYTLKIKEKFSDFNVRYPSLFNVIIEDPQNFDYNRLIHMLNLKDKISSNETSHESASIKIGQQYYDEFVKKTVDNLNI